MKSTIVESDHCYSSDFRYSCHSMVSLIPITWFVIKTVTVKVNFECGIILTWVPRCI